MRLHRWSTGDSGIIWSIAITPRSFLIQSSCIYLSTIYGSNTSVWILFVVNRNRINFHLLWTFCPHLGSFCVVSSFTTFRPNFTSGLLQVILPRPQIGMLSLVTISPVITAFHSCCLSHHVFDQVNLWPAWVGFETAIFWQCSPGTVETQHLYLLRHIYILSACYQ